MKKWIGAMVLSVVVALLRALNRARDWLDGGSEETKGKPDKP